MWIYDKTGRRVNADIENAAQMLEHCEHSMLYPKGTAEEETTAFEKQKAADLALIPEKTPEEVEGQSVEVHVARRRHREE